MRTAISLLLLLLCVPVWAGTDGTKINGSRWIVGTWDTQGPVDEGSASTFADTDATPDVDASKLWDTFTNALTITDFDGTIEEGYTIIVYSKGAITFDCTGAGFECGSADGATASGDVTVWRYDGSQWHLTSFKDQSTDMWTDAGAAGGDSVSIDSVAVVDPDFVSTGQVDFTDSSNTVTADINDDSILEADLKAVNAVVDEDILTYESTTGDFEWHTPAELSLQPLDDELTLIAGLAETTGNVMIGVGGAWASVAQPIIDCTNCTSLPAGSHTGTIAWGGTSILDSGAAFGFGDGGEATLTHTYANTGTDVVIAYSTAAMAVTGTLTATNLSGTNTGDVAADSLDFTEFTDTMTLDADTSITIGDDEELSFVTTDSASTIGTGSIAIAATFADDADATDFFQGLEIGVTNNSGDAGDSTSGIRVTIADGSADEFDQGFIVNYADAAGALDVGYECNTSAGGALTTCIFASDADIVNAINIGANNILTSGATIAAAELERLDGVGSALCEFDLSNCDAELVTLGGLTETNGNVIFAAGDAWTSDATPAIDCTDCTSNLESADNDTTQVATTSFVQQEINGAGGTHLTCSSGSCSVDSEVTTRSVLHALVEDVAATDEFVFMLEPYTGTMTRVDCESFGLGGDSCTSVTINICDGEDIGDDTCTTSIFDATASTTLTCTASPTADTSLNATGFAARDKVSLVVTAVSGDCALDLMITGTVDD